MQRTIRGRVYDTDTADCIATRFSGCYGDPAGYEERLYRTDDGYFFLYGVGGSSSPYTDETIRAVSKSRADEWQEQG